MFRCHDFIPFYTTQPIVINFCLPLSFPLNLPLSPLLILILPTSFCLSCVHLDSNTGTLPLPSHGSITNVLPTQFENTSCLASSDTRHVYSFDSPPIPHHHFNHYLPSSPIRSFHQSNFKHLALLSSNLNCTPTISETCLPQSLTMISTTSHPSLAMTLLAALYSSVYHSGPKPFSKLPCAHILQHHNSYHNFPKLWVLPCAFSQLSQIPTTNIWFPDLLEQTTPWTLTCLPYLLPNPTSSPVCGLNLHLTGYFKLNLSIHLAYLVIFHSCCPI